ncbi:hypothetical protein O181_042463 [Austropuccinia psidii MF-1]|uniref:DUF4219 domain-containing protein n=1 Tax=Austropuccinia psidii MF-1 TaxID=1389203 RepID=A0A9Q3HET2_9BASI|nr:hypothetical protein [Austropuccinia psidii MF-1]
MPTESSDNITDNKDTISIPVLDGSNYGHWSLRMKIHLRSRDLLEVCEKPIAEEATPSAVNKCTKACYDSIDIITTRINEKGFREVVNEETYANAYLLKSKITDQYASNCAVNRGRVCMEWQCFIFYGNPKNYIEDCRKITMELKSVNIKVPNDLLSFSLLGKIGGNRELHHFFDSLTLNEELIERPDLILTRLQDYASIHKKRISSTEGNTCALVTTTNNEPQKKVYYCRKS